MEKISAHALQQYSVRTGLSIGEPIKAMECLTDRLNGYVISTKNIDIVKKYGVNTVLHHRKGASYKLWHEPIINEVMCAIIRNNVVVTIISQSVYSLGREKDREKIRLEHPKGRGLNV